jgi:hypothetical protein
LVLPTFELIRARTLEQCTKDMDSLMLGDHNTSKLDSQVSKLYRNWRRVASDIIKVLDPESVRSKEAPPIGRPSISRIFNDCTFRIPPSQGALQRSIEKNGGTIVSTSPVDFTISPKDSV